MVLPDIFLFSFFHSRKKDMKGLPWLGEFQDLKINLVIKIKEDWNKNLQNKMKWNHCEVDIRFYCNLVTISNFIFVKNVLTQKIGKNMQKK